MTRRTVQVLVDGLCALALLSLVALALRGNPLPAVLPADAEPQLTPRRHGKKRRRPLPPRRLVRR